MSDNAEQERSAIVQRHDDRQFAWGFGPYRLFPSERVLVDGEKQLPLAVRALDLLIALVERAGELIPKDDLVSRVWPATFVEESNLRVHLAKLRRALGQGREGARYIVTEAGRGYRFVVPVSRLEGAVWTPGAAPIRRPALPPLNARIIGRSEAVGAIAGRLPTQRLLTIVGPPGIGKTMLAVTVAETLSDSYHGYVRFVDLAPLETGALVPAALATSLGLTAGADSSLSGLLTFLRDKRVLIVLDNCEHVVDAAARLALTIVSEARGVAVLATSREPLRVDGEWVHRLGPLDLPSATADLNAATAFAFGSIQLFAEQAAATADDFELTDGNAARVAEICRRLDGIPLAIELAAATVDLFSLPELAARLNNRLGSARARRTAAPRHQTMQAALDWSHQLLSTTEQAVLRRLSVFRSGFGLESAAAVASLGDLSRSAVMESVAGLAAKSLLVSDVSGETAVHRLLETTRDYAAIRLAESGEGPATCRAHAEHCRDLLVEAAGALATLTRSDWLASYARLIDNPRGAIDWALSPAGDPVLAASLTALSATLWFQLSLMAEYRVLAERALAGLSSLREPQLQLEMQLWTALGHAWWHADSAAPRMAEAFRHGLAIADRIGAVPFQMRALWGLWSERLVEGDYPGGVPLVARFRELAAAAGDTNSANLGDRMGALSAHFNGDQTAARQHIERVMADPATHSRSTRATSFQFDQRAVSHAIIARVLWVQGYPDQAMRHAEASVDEALAVGHALSLCFALGLAACQVALWVGDASAAGRHVAMLLRTSAEHSLVHWHGWGRGYQVALGAMNGVPVPAPAIGELTLSQIDCAVAGGAESLGAAVIERAGDRRAAWFDAELMRLRARAVLRIDPTRTGEAERLLSRSLEIAAAQGALSWQLRSATDLARLWQGRDAAKALAIIEPVRSLLTEGFATRDVVVASNLLAELRAA